MAAAAENREEAPQAKRPRVDGAPGAEAEGEGEGLQAAIRAGSMRSKLLSQAEKDNALKDLFRDVFQVESIPVVANLPRRVLVTGAGGLLGSALVKVLSHQGVEVVGLDVHDRTSTTTVVASVTDAKAVATAMANCEGVIHTAALHAPDQEKFSEDDFYQVNVVGTENILRSAESLGIPVVFTSTTSLMMTLDVKAKMAAGQTVWLSEASPQSEPRNKYGRTKLEAEQRCLAKTNTNPVVVVRTPRFFVEDGIEEPDPLCGQENLRAVELCTGRRAALEDLVEAHLLALANAQKVDKQLFILAPLVAPALQSCTQITESVLKSALGEEGVEAFARVGWRLPKIVDRVYDGKAAHERLGWRPRWTPEAFVSRLTKGDPRALRAAF